MKSLSSKSLLASLAVLLCLSFQSANADGSKPAGVFKTGTLKGLNKHKVTGVVTIVKTADGYVAKLSEDFFLDAAPDPQLAFGKSTAKGKRGYDKSTLFAKLKALRGGQSFKIPARINPADYDEIYVWCPKFYVGLGKADLK